MSASQEQRCDTSVDELDRLRAALAKAVGEIARLQEEKEAICRGAGSVVMRMAGEMLRLQDDIDRLKAEKEAIRRDTVAAVRWDDR